MENLFTNQEKEYAFKVRRILLGIFIALTVIAWLFNIAVVVCFYQRLINKVPAIFINSVITVLWGGFTLFFFGLKFPVVNKFCKMLKNTETGLRDEITLKFVRFDETLVTKDGVEFFTMNMLVKPNKLGLTEGERSILIEKTRQKPDIVEGDVLKVITHANILVGYEKLTN